MYTLDTPIAFLVFNRPDTTRQVFAAIQSARPSRLLIVADGPRHDHSSDARLCNEVREIVNNVTWPCQVDINFATENMGCRERVISGLNWVFSLVEEAIILEDDCLPHPCFFRYCSELLFRFRDDARIGMISGTNFVEHFISQPYSYYFSQMFHIWGWATWRRAWAQYDPSLKDWPAIKADKVLSEVIDDARLIKYLSDIFDQMHNGSGPNTWDYQWLYSNLVNHSLSVVPRNNLITNIGFGPGATHTTDTKSAQVLPSREIQFPLRHPPSLVSMRTLDCIDMRTSFLPTWKQRVFYRLSLPVRYLLELMLPSRS